MTAHDDAVKAIDSARARLSADATAQRVARVYAEALYGEADKRGGERQAITSVLEELEFVSNEVAASDPVIRTFFVGGIVGRDRRRDALQKAFTGKLSELALHFLLVLNHHERLELLRSVLVVYRQLVEERSGQVRVLVRTAVPLPDDQRERLVNELRQMTRREPVLQTRLDPDMLGGLIVQVGDWLYDASVRHQLEIIRNQLIESSSHEIQYGRDRFSHQG
jgi:F-type H+-transporting ATPase subunit delta